MPEILFVLKEIMDIPGYAFISAFDPSVVGEVLGRYHPGFGDGLKFLEKIIDYPRWLPPPTDKGMQGLAHADMVNYCPYVPLSAMNDILPHLPPNPRILRKYIRLLAFLKPQIDRHYETELNWPVILAADLIKVLYPKIAQRLFDDDTIWSEISTAMLIDIGKESEEDKIGDLLSKHLANIKQATDEALKTDDNTRIMQILRVIAKSSSPFMGGSRAITYQIRVAEAPSAVTWKEYDAFISDWKTDKSSKRIKKWISSHAKTAGRTHKEVYLELLGALIHRRIDVLDQAGEEILKANMKSQLHIADELLTLLEQFVFDCGGLNSDVKLFGAEQIENIIKSFMRYIGWKSSAEHRILRKREKKFLKKMVAEWAGDITPLINILLPHSYVPERLRDEPEKMLYQELSIKVMKMLAGQVLSRFQEKDFIRYIRKPSRENGAVCHILFDVDGPLWKGLRKEMIRVLAKAATDINVQLNAYELLYMYEYKCRREPDFEDTKSLKTLLGNKYICNALWKAAMAVRLNPRYVGALQLFPNRMKELGVTLRMPVWWPRELEALGIKK